MVSAYLNTPPANQLDVRIAAGLLLSSGLTPDIKDPRDGVTMPPFRPNEGYVFETKGPGIIAALCVCMVIVTVIVFARLGIRILVRECRFGMDDWLILPAYLLAMIYPALQIIMIQYGGAGKHLYDITYQEYYHYSYLASTAATVHNVYIGVVKMSIACFNIRLTSISSRFWRSINYGFLGLCVAYTIAALFLNVFKCNPQSAGFDLLKIAESGKVPKCLTISHVNSILRVNLALDFTALAIPVIFLWKVQMTWNKKARLFALLSIGLIACIASVMSLVSQFTLATDPLWNYTTLLAWLMVDLVVSILAASAPTLSYLLPRSMKYQTRASNRASKSFSQGIASRLSRNEFMEGTHTLPSENADSDDNEQYITVKDEIEMEWQGTSASQGSDSKSRPTSWDDENNTKNGTKVYDGSDERQSNRAWVSAAERNQQPHAM